MFRICLPSIIKMHNKRKKGADMKFYLRRFFTLIITLFFVALLTFLAFEIIPGDAALTKLGIDAQEADIEALREQLGLNQPVVRRFFHFIIGAIHGDFGTSIQYRVSVTQLIADRLPVTIWLAGLSMLLIVLFSLPFGLFGVGKGQGGFHRAVACVNQIIMAVPPFFLGILFSLIFGLGLKLFIPGSYPGTESFGKFLNYMIFPAAAVAIPKIAMTVNFLQSSVLVQMKQDYVRTAKSKGCSRKRILFHHVLKNALIPSVTFLAMTAADVLAGSIVIEQVFNLPGMGRMLITAISYRDFPVVEAAVLYIAAVVIFINFFVDLAYQKLDPRIRITDPQGT